jgi:hypothetical protein
MASFVVMEPPPALADRDAILVRDGFHVLAFLVPFVWLLWHRLWIEAAIAFALMLALSALGTVAGLGNAAPVLSFLVSIYVGLEGPALRIAAWRRRGWDEWGVVEADDAADGELRYVAEAAAEPDISAPPPRQASWRATSGTVRPSGDTAQGLFNYPGAR